MEENVITPTNKNLFIQTFSAVLHSVECQKAVNMLICDQWEVSAPNPSVEDCILLKLGLAMMFEFCECCDSSVRTRETRKAEND